MLESVQSDKGEWIRFQSSGEGSMENVVIGGFVGLLFFKGKTFSGWSLGLFLVTFLLWVAVFDSKIFRILSGCRKLWLYLSFN